MSIDCMAGGNPPPRIIWTKAGADPSLVAAQLQATSGGNSPTGGAGHHSSAASKAVHHLGSWRSIVSSPHLQVYENGSLNVLEARDSDAGHYMCQASNGVGPGLSKVIRLTINVAAQFNTRHSVQYVIKGEQTHLKCQAKGDWPMAVHWFKNRHRLEPVSIQDHSAGQSQAAGGSGPSGPMSQPLSSSVASVMMRPAAGGGNGLSQRGYQSDRQHPLPLMDQLNDLLQSGGSLASSDGGANGLLVSRYSLASTEVALNNFLALDSNHNSANGNGGDQAPAGELNGSSKQTNSLRQQPLVVQLSAILTVNQAGRQDTGTFKCIATNNFGLDERTIQLVVQEAPDRIEELEVLQSEVKSRSITLKWLAPFDGNAPITSYHVQYRAVSLGSRSASSSSQMSQETLNGLSWFNYTLASALLSSTSEASQVVTTSSSAASPSSSSSGSRVLIQQLQQVTHLNQNGDGNNNNNNYHQLQSAASAASAATMTTLAALATSGSAPTGRAAIKLTISSLRPVTSYWFRVEAENKLGRSSISSVVESATLEEAPSGAPTKLKAVAQSSSSALVSWSRVSEKELFGRVSGYYVAYKPAVGSPPEADPKQVALAGNATASSADPAIDPMSQQATVNIFKTIEHDDKLTKFDALLTGLRRSTKYMITVQAFNSIGAGPASDPVMVKTLDMDPPKQVKLFVRQSSNCTIQLEWRPLSLAAVERQQQQADGAKSSASRVGAPVALPATYGDEPTSKSSYHQQRSGSDSTPDIVDYYSLYQAELNDRPQWQEVKLPGYAHQHTVENLRCGTRYQFYMMGANKIGVGDQSDILDTRTLGGLPLAPDRQSTFDVTNATCYTIRLDHWQDNGCPIRSFNIRFKPEVARDWSQLAHFDFPGSQTAQSGKQLGATGGPAKSFVGEYPASGLRVRRSPAESSGEDAYVFSMDDGRDDEDSFFDYSANDRSSDNVQHPNSFTSLEQQNDLDYESDQASATISSVANLSSDPWFFSLLKDSALPAFDELDQAAHLEPIQRPNLHQLPPVAQEWQASNFVVENSSKSTGDQNLRAAQVMMRSASLLEGDKQVGDWRRVKFCNLAENIYYSVQITASNSVGETEAELKILTSQEGLEFDQEVKRQVVGRLGGNRMAQSIAAGDRLNGLFVWNQWPILLPVTLTITLMTIIIIMTLILKRNHSSGSTATTTTTTTTTAMGSSSSHCQNYLDESHSGHHHHHPHSNGHLGLGSSSFKTGAPSAITEATIGSDFTSINHHHQHSIEGNYAIAGHRDAYGNMAIYQQHRSSQSVLDEPAYGVVGLAQQFNQNNNDQSTNRSSGSPATTTAAAPSLTHSGGSSSGTGNSNQHSCTMPRQMHQADNMRARNVYLCSQDDTNNNMNLNSSQEISSPNVFYGLTQQPPNVVYNSQTKEPNYVTSRQLFNQADLFNGANNMPISMQQLEQQNEQQQNGAKLDFLTIVEEVARANENLRQAGAQTSLLDGKPMESHNILDSSCQLNGYDQQQLQQQMDDCFSSPAQQNGGIDNNPFQQPSYAATQTVRALVDESMAKLQQSQDQGEQAAEVASGQLMFDPVYATIRRTFPQAFRYLTLQHQSHHHQHQQLQQQLASAAAAVNSNGSTSTNPSNEQYNQNGGEKTLSR